MDYMLLNSLLAPLAQQVNLHSQRGLQKQESLVVGPVQIKTMDTAKLKDALKTSSFKAIVDEPDIFLKVFQDKHMSLDEREPYFDITALMYCAIFGNTGVGSKLLEQGATVDLKDKNGFTALAYSCIFSNYDFVCRLIEKGADVNVKDKSSMSPLLWAVSSGNENIVRALLAAKTVDVNVHTFDGVDALQIAAEKNLVNIAKVLLENHITLNSKEAYGWSALMRSARNDHWKFVKLLVGEKANVNETNLEGNSALHISIIHKGTESSSILIKQENININNPNKLGVTALMFASLNGDSRIVKKLFKQGAAHSINAKCKKGDTALFYAILGKNEDVIETLLQNNADTNVVNNLSESPLIVATVHRNFNLTEMLLKRKIKSRTVDNEHIRCLVASVANRDTASVKMLLSHSKTPLKDIAQSCGIQLCLLHLASVNGDIDIVKHILDAGEDVNVVNANSETALIPNITAGHVNIVQLLISNEADVNWSDLNGETPLMVASSTGNMQIVKSLLKKGAKKNSTNLNGFSAFMQASYMGHLDIVQILFNSEQDVDQTDSQKWTSLMLSSWNGHTEVVKHLLKKGACPNRVSTLGVTALNIAAGHGKTDVVSELLISRASLNEEDSNGTSALIMATICRHAKVVDLLIEAGADVNHSDSYKKTALMYAAHQGDACITSSLIKGKGDCSLKDEVGWTPLMLCSQNGFKECMKLILKEKVPLDEVEASGHTALNISAANGHVDAVWLLLENGAKPNIPNNKGLTPLMLAAKNGFAEIIKHLLYKHNNNKAKINETDKEGKTALLFAAEHNQTRALTTLIEAGANVNATSNADTSALHLSAMYGDNDNLSILLATKKVKINRADKDGNTPLLLCAQHGSFWVLKRLIDAGADIKNKNKVGDNAFHLSIKSNCVEALKILLENGKISEDEKMELIGFAKGLGRKDMEFLIQQMGNKTSTARMEAQTFTITPDESSCLSEQKASSLKRQTSSSNGDKVLNTIEPKENITAIVNINITANITANNIDTLKVGEGSSSMTNTNTVERVENLATGNSAINYKTH